jgi:GntR family transcriptional regulator
MAECYATDGVSAESRPAVDAGTRHAGVAAYNRLYVTLAQKLREGELAAGDPFLSENEIRTAYSLSRVTVRKALELLEKDGLIVRRQGARTSVAAWAQDKPSGRIERLRARSHEAKATTLERGWRAPTPAAAAALRLPQGCDCLVVRRMRLHEGEPFSYAQIYLTPRAAACLPEADLGDAPILSLLEKAGYLASHAEQTLTATLAQEPVASALGVPLGSALLQLRRTVFDKESEPFLFEASLYRPDKYEYEMRLSRDNASFLSA